MRVFLKENWFGFGGVRYRKGFHDLPDDLCAVDEKGKFLHLPRSTTRDKPAEKKPFADAKEMKTLRDHDLERAGANAQADVERKAQAEADRIAQEQADANFVAAKGSPHRSRSRCLVIPRPPVAVVNALNGGHHGRRTSFIR